jgi:hypothetical protein
MTDVTQVITVTGQLMNQASIAPSGSDLLTWQLTSITDSQLTITATIGASTYDPYQDPPGDQVAGSGSHPVPYRPPVHVAVHLTLSVTPAPGQPATGFPIILDAIV